jgi:WD40 repeat protein
VVSFTLQELVFTASQDQSIRVWGVQKTAPCAHVLRVHDGPVTGLSLHATGDYVLSCSSDAVSFIQVVHDLSKSSIVMHCCVLRTATSFGKCLSAG